VALGGIACNTDAPGEFPAVPTSSGDTMVSSGGDTPETTDGPAPNTTGSADATTNVDTETTDDAASSSTGDGPRDPLALGPTVELGAGEDPDIAIDSTGGVHVVYSRGGSTYYVHAADLSSPSAEVLVGPGDDPQLVLDSQDQPHVVMGEVRYARWVDGAFATANELVDGWRKPRIAIDGEDRVYVTVSQMADPRVILFALQDGDVLAGPVAVGDDNNGAVAVDSQGLVHITWRSTRVYHNTYSLRGGAGTSAQLHTSSDFSWCDVDVRDDSLHLINTIPHGEGLNYRVLRDGAWSEALTLAAAEVQGVDDPDNVGPTIAVDSEGYRYVTFAGRDRVPYYLVVGPDDQPSAVYPLDVEGGTLSGGKFENPNVATHRSRPGAFISWGADTVYVRAVGH